MREAFWNCPHCGTAGVPGRETECPTCGRARPAGTPLYVSPETEEEGGPRNEAEAPAGEDAAADWTCAFCGDRNAADARDCPGCGAPRTPVIDRGPAASPVIAPAPAPQAAPAQSGGCCGIACGSIIGALVLFVLFISWAAHKGSRAPVGGEDLAPAQVVAKTGSRNIVVERRRGGQWEPVRTETARSDGGPLEWPAVKLAKGERLGRRTEEYHIRYHMPAGPDQDLNTYRMFWEPLAVGQRVALRRTRDGVEAHPYPVDSLSECRRWYRGLPGATPQTDLGCTPPPAKP